MLAEYALRGIDKPIGVSTYELTRALPAEPAVGPAHGRGDRGGAGRHVAAHVADSQESIVNHAEAAKLDAALAANLKELGYGG